MAADGMGVAGMRLKPNDFFGSLQASPQAEASLAAPDLQQGFAPEIDGPENLTTKAGQVESEAPARPG